jgi:hypothetical protein
MTEKDWISNYLKQLVGCTITEAFAVSDDSGIWPVIVATRQDGTKFNLEISRDPEGNGPGFIFGLPNPMLTN